MADQGPIVVVDRGDGNLINMATNVAKTFVAENSGAKIIGPKRVHTEDEITEMEIAATAAQGGKPLGEHTVAELKQIASDEGIDLAGASKKDELVAAIEAGRASNGEDAAGTE